MVCVLTSVVFMTITAVNLKGSQYQDKGKGKGKVIPLQVRCGPEGG